VDFEEWVRFGFEQGWCSPPVCQSHDGTPMSEDEDDDMWEGADSCIHIIRLYESDIHKRKVEKNSPPARWRASNRGW